MTTAKLCNAFLYPKGCFPFNLNDIYYSGTFPAFEYWTDNTNKEWETLKNNHGTRMWSFQLEALNFCELDCKSLHEVLSKFNELIFEKFNINIHK